MSARCVRLAIGEVTPGTQRAIDAAIRLARALGEPLHCLFVEEADLFDAAALPFTREMGVVAPSPRRLDAQALAGALRRQAERARREVAEAARRSHVTFDFDVARGRLPRVPLERAGSDDVVVIGMGSLELVPVAPSRGDERLLAVFESLPQAIASLRAAIGAMPGARAEVWQHSPAAGQRVDDALRALEHEFGRPIARLAPAAGGREPTVAEVVTRVRPRVLAIDRASLESAPPELLRALRRLGIVVVAAPSTR